MWQDIPAQVEELTMKSHCVPDEEQHSNGQVHGAAKIQV